MNQIPADSELSGSSTLSRSLAIRWLVPAYLSTVVAAIGIVMLGPLLPSLMMHWQVQDAQAGTLFAASFAGQFCGACFGARSLRGSLLYGSLLSAVSFLSLAWAGVAAAHLALFCVGLGLGAGLTASNIIAGTTIPAARTRLLAILGVAWGAGAIASPLLVKLCAPGGPQRFFYVTSLCLGISALAAMAIPRTADPAQPPTGASTQRGLPLPVLELVAFASAIFLYVGIENSLGGWLPSYALRSGLVLLPTTASLCFWLAELTGRILTPILLIIASETVLYRVCLAALILVEILLDTLRHPSGPWIVGFVIAAGLMLAPLFPLILSFMLSRTTRNERLGPLFAVASLGGALLPWLTGVLSTERHSLRIGLLVPTIGAVSLLCLSAIVTGTRRTNTYP